MSDTSIWKLMEVLFWLPVMSLLFVAVHELGHLVAAYLVGAVPTEISIGSGERRRIFEIGPLDITIRRKLLGGGYVAFGLVQGRHLRWRVAAILLSGVGAEIVFWIVVFLPLLSIESLTFARSFPSLGIAALAVSVWHVVISSAAYDTEVGPTDGKRLLLLTRNEWKELYPSRDFLVEEHLIQRSIRAGCFGDVLELAERRLEKGVEDQVFGPAGSELGWLFLLGERKGHALLQLGRYPEAIRVAEQQRDSWAAMELPDLDMASEDREKELAFQGNSLAYGLALEGSQLERALVLAEAAVEAADGVDYKEVVLGTLGAVLVQVGREGEGIELLNQTLSIAPTAMDRFETHRFLALGYRAEGDIEAAVSHCEQALAICPDFAERVEPILAGLAADGGRSLPGALKG